MLSYARVWFARLSAGRPTGLRDQVLFAVRWIRREDTLSSLTVQHTTTVNVPCRLSRDDKGQAHQRPLENESSGYSPNSQIRLWHEY